MSQVLQHCLTVFHLFQNNFYKVIKVVPDRPGLNLPKTSLLQSVADSAIVLNDLKRIVAFKGKKLHETTLRKLLTCLAKTSSVMKKMNRDTEPMVFRSFRTPGL